MQLTLKITQDQSAKLLAMKDAGKRMIPPLAQAWAQGAKEVMGRAVRGRFTGQGPFPVSQNKLGIVTNRLRKSLRTTPVQVNAGTGEISISQGSNVSYFASHEFGYKGRVQVRGHTRRAVAGNRRRDTTTEWGGVTTTSRGKLTKKTAKGLKTAAKRGRANYSLVRPHSRKVNILARRPLGTELAALSTRALFYAKFKAVMARVLGGGA